jgi:hypothetical protein
MKSEKRLLQEKRLGYTCSVNKSMSCRKTVLFGVIHPPRWAVFFVMGALSCILSEAQESPNGQMPLANRLPDAAWDVGLRNVITDVERIDAPRQYENYNVNLDPFYMKFAAGMRTAWTDNINLGDKGQREDDFIFTPHADIGMMWEVTESNTLTTNLGLSYNKYVKNPDADSDTVMVSPETATDFTVFLGEYFRLVFYDQLAVLQDPTETIDANFGGDPQVSDTLDYHRLYNSGGVVGIWNLNEKTTVTAGYRNTYVKALNDEFEIIDRMTHSVHADMTYSLDNSQEVGVFGSTGWSDYRTDENNDNLMTTLGVFFDTPLTEYLSGRFTGAYVFGDFDEGGEIEDDSGTLHTYDVSAQLNHRLNQALSHSLATGRTVRLGITSNYYDLIYVRHSTSWNIVENLSLGTNAFAEWGSESDSYTGSDFTRWGAGVTLGYQFSEKFRASLGYTYIRKNSDGEGGDNDDEDGDVRYFYGDYYQNRVTLDFDYRF